MKHHQSIRTQNLQKILLGKYIPTEEINSAFNTSELLESFYKSTFMEIYHSLGGMMNNPKLTFQVPFMEFGRFSVVLDESIHFNRYRTKTLRSSFYENLLSFPLIKYRSYCRKYEVECLKSGTSRPFWTNAEAERHFGTSQASGDLGLSGSSGWKLIALQDFATDMIARIRKIRLLRISVWEDLLINKKLKKFNELLISPGKVESEVILQYIERRIVNLYADDF